jgi:hypothetical protein
MFKSIKEFFVGKPKVEEPVAVTTEPVIVTTESTVVVTEPAVVVSIDTVAAAQPVQPVLEEIKPETVTISISDNMNVNIGPPDTIVLTQATDSITWPFPTVPPVEAEVKKKRTPATGKKPTPAITATKPKPRKKK